MPTREGSKSRWVARAVGASLVVVLALGLFGLGTLLSNTYGAAQVAHGARQLHWTNAALGASGIARAAIAQGVFFSYEDVSNVSGAQRAIDEAKENLATVSELADTQDAPTEGAARQLIDDFVDSGLASIGLAESGDSTSAEAVRLTETEPAYDALRTELEERQTEFAALIADSDQTAGRISRITFVAISFFIPAVTMIVFWLLLRRRVRERENEMQAQISAQRALNQAKDEFIAGLSHELRTPLTSIVGFSELLIDNPSLDEEAMEQLTLIHGSSADLNRMVEDLLVAARIDAGALSVSPRSLNLADEAAAATSSHALSGETIDVRVPPIDVYADSLHVRQIIHNLVSNAVRHGGRRILVTASERTSTAMLVVADDGPGVAPEIEERLFHRFVHEGREALVAGSVGLGLAISQELARRMGGALRYGRTNGWTTFTLVIPLVPRTKARGEAKVLTRTET